LLATKILISSSATAGDKNVLFDFGVALERGYYSHKIFTPLQCCQRNTKVKMWKISGTKNGGSVK